MSLTKFIAICVGILILALLFNVFPDGKLSDSFKSALMRDSNAEEGSSLAQGDGSAFSKVSADDEENYRHLTKENVFKRGQELSKLDKGEKEHRWGQ